MLLSYGYVLVACNVGPRLRNRFSQLLVCSAAAKRALQQVEDKQYAQEFQQRNIAKHVKIGIGFEGKTFALEYLIAAP